MSAQITPEIQRRDQALLEEIGKCLFRTGEEFDQAVRVWVDHLVEIRDPRGQIAAEMLTGQKVRPAQLLRDLGQTCLQLRLSSRAPTPWITSRAEEQHEERRQRLDSRIPWIYQDPYDPQNKHVFIRLSQVTTESQ